MTLPEPANPYESLVLADVPRYHAARTPDAVALVFHDRTTTYRELDERASQTAQALLAAAGLAPGARVATLLRDSDHYVELVFGVAKAGMVLLPMNWRLTVQEVLYILRNAGAELLFVGPDHAARLDELAAALPGLQLVVAGAAHPGRPAYPAWREGFPAEDPRRAASPEDVVIQMYTSGTTGHPKGVQLPNRSLLAVIAATRARGGSWLGWSAADVALQPGIGFHIGGLWWLATTLAAGARAVLLETFIGWRMLEAIAQHRVTKVCVAPAMLQLALSEPGGGDTDFSSLGHIVYGGSPISESLLRRAAQVFGCQLAQIYGLTETGNCAVTLLPEQHDLDSPGRLRAAGRPFPGVEIKCIDRDHQPLPAGEVGEICIKSPASMIGYWDAPAATAETLVDGWIHTGDAGFLDEDGYLTICDRVKDMIIYAAENVYPAEIEAVLCEHPAVRAAAVIGVPDERWGELVKAIVVCEPSQQPPASELMAFVRKRLAAFKVPTSIDFAAELPRTPLGKIRKEVLRAPYWQGRSRQI